MPVLVAISTNNVTRDTILFHKATQYEYIEYVSIYPHYIFFNSEINYVKDGILYRKNMNDKDSIIINLYSIDNRITNNEIFAQLIACNDLKCLFLIFCQNISNINILNFVKNISIKLNRISKEVNTNKDY